MIRKLTLKLRLQRKQRNMMTIYSIKKMILQVLFVMCFFAFRKDLLAQPKKTLPNIIIILADDMGYGDLGCYGSKTNLTTNIDKLATEGIKFTNFYATPLCTPSRSALLTGTYPIRNSMATNYRGECVCFPVDEKGLHPNEFTIPEILKQQHYATALIGKWHLGDQREFLPTKQGFDYFFGLPYSNDTSPEFYEEKVKKVGAKLYPYPEIPLLRNETVVEQPVNQKLLTQRYTEEAKHYIVKNKNTPFFLFLSHTMPHNPLAVSDRFNGISNKSLYSDVISELDWSVGEIIHALDSLKIRDNTIVIFLSDNGAPAQPAERSNAPFSGYKGTVKEGGTRVPMIINWNKHIKTNEQNPTACSIIDLMPTIAYLTNTKVPTDRVIDGKNIWQWIHNPDMKVQPHSFLPYYLMDQLQAIRKDNWKLYLPLTSTLNMLGKDTGPQKIALFDLDNDTIEKVDLSEKYPEKVQQLLAMATIARTWIGDRNCATPHTRPAGYVEQPVPLLKEKK